MKTPIQELIEKLKEERSKLQALNERVMVLTLDYAIADAEQMLEKEKEQIMSAYEVSHISMMTAEQYYNETFRTK
jgi:hypothetical protein